MIAKTTIQLFIPAAFCGLISALALFAGDCARPSFYAFLPMCFFFSAAPLVAMNKRISDLEEKLKQAESEDS